jgi:beta-glucosidase
MNDSTKSCKAARLLAAFVFALGLVGCATPVPGPTSSALTSRAPTPWPPALRPQVRAPYPVLEARISAILNSMTLLQKVGQMTQPEIRSVTPDQVRQHYIGSVLNGGGTWPQGNKAATAAQWLALSEAFHTASLRTDMATPVPILWGTDAVHGHNNVMGATLFPHNIGLGAADNPALVQEIGAATARAVRATGIAWTFAPTLAVARDARWGRTYESYSEDPARVARLGGAMVAGLQQGLASGQGVLATAKHYIGDGGTEAGMDQGLTQTTATELFYPARRGLHRRAAARRADGDGVLQQLGRHRPPPRRACTNRAACTATATC